MLIPLENFPGYFISDSGEVFSTKKGKTMQKKDSTPRGQYGYRIVTLYSNGKRCTKYLHRLVTNAFLGECPRDKEVCHNDGDKNNNNLSNLRYDSHKNNYADREKHGTFFQGESFSWAKLKSSDIPLIRELLINSHMTQKRIGDIFGVSTANISLIASGKIWSHIY